jgi:hypothetical protein
MHDSETRALRRTALLLLAVSAVHLMWPVRCNRTDARESIQLLGGREIRVDALALLERPKEPLARLGVLLLCGLA